MGASGFAQLMGEDPGRAKATHSRSAGRSPDCRRAVLPACPIGQRLSRTNRSRVQMRPQRIKHCERHLSASTCPWSPDEQIGAALMRPNEISSLGNQQVQKIALLLGHGGCDAQSVSPTGRVRTILTRVFMFEISTRPEGPTPSTFGSVVKKLVFRNRLAPLLAEAR
jgi:hypothetical protein